MAERRRSRGRRRRRRESSSSVGWWVGGILGGVALLAVILVVVVNLGDDDSADGGGGGFGGPFGVGVVEDVPLPLRNPRFHRSSSGQPLLLVDYEFRDGDPDPVADYRFRANGTAQLETFEFQMPAFTRSHPPARRGTMRIEVVGVVDGPGGDATGAVFQGGRRISNELRFRIPTDFGRLPPDPEIVSLDDVARTQRIVVSNPRLITIEQPFRRRQVQFDYEFAAGQPSPSAAYVVAVELPGQPYPAPPPGFPSPGAPHPRQWNQLDPGTLEARGTLSVDLPREDNGRSPVHVKINVESPDRVDRRTISNDAVLNR